MKTRINPYLFAVLLSAAAPFSQAAVFFWDGANSTANADGGSGTWDTATANWNDVATGGASVTWPTSGEDNDASFGGTAGTVTVDSLGVTANDLTFATTGYTVNGAGLTLNGTLPVINVTGTATINSAITTATVGGFSKTGSGTLILGGANTFPANTTLAYGTTTANVGALRLANSSALGGVTLINGVPSSGAATQARIELTNNITITGTEIRGGGRQTQQGVGALLVNISGDNTWAGAVRINGTGGGHGIRSDAGTLTISGAVNSMIGARTWEIGGTGNVAVSGAITTAVSLVKFGSGNLTISGTNSFTGTTKIGAGSLVITNASALASSTLDLAATDTGTFSFGPALTSATFGGLTGARNLALINTAATPAAVVLTSGANNTSTTYTGILSGSGSFNKSGTGTLTLDPGAEATVSVNSLSANGGTLLLKSGAFTTTGIDPFNTAYVTGAGARGGTFTLDGASLTIGGTNANRSFKPGAATNGNANIISGSLVSPSVVVGHNGTVVINQSGGTVTTNIIFHQDGGAGTYTLSGGVLNVQSIYNNTQAANAFTLNLNGGTLRPAAGTTNLIRTNNTGTQIGVFLGAGNTQIDTSVSSATIARPMGDMTGVAGTFTKVGANALTLSQANTHTGDTTVSEGSLVLTASGALGSSTVNLAGGNVVFSGITEATFGGLKGTGDLALTNAASAAVALTTGLNGQATSYGGVISGDGSLTKAGAGSFTLTNASTYTGGTTVSAGTLIVANINGSATGTGLVTVAGGVLGGTGSISGGVVVGTGARLDPGVTTGTLTVGGAVGGAGTLAFQVSEAASDKLVAGSVDPSTLNLELQVTGDLTANAYVLVDSASAVSGAFASITGVPSGYTVAYIYNDGTDSNNIALVKAATTTPFENWAGTTYGLTGGDAAPSADPDFDGLSNLVEFVIGGNPKASGDSLPIVAISGANMVFTFRRTDLAMTQPGIGVVADYSTNLATWTPAVNGTDGVTIVVTDDGFATGVDKVEVFVPRSLANSGKLFARLRATLP